MITSIREKEINEIYQTPIIQQTAFWSEVKRRLGLRTAAIDFTVNRQDILPHSESNCKTYGDMVVLVRRLDNNNSIAYVPYGPEMEPDEQSQGIFLEELSESIRSFIPSDCIMVRYDLAWESYWARDPDFFDTNGTWLGPPGNSVQEIRFNYSTLNWNFRKTFSNNLPVNTIFIDLTKGRDELLRSMKPKTRYNIHLSERKGVTVRIAGINELDIWYNLYSETAARNRFHLHHPDYFRTILSVNADSSRSPADVLLLIAEKDGEPLASIFLVISGNRGTYLYGASSSESRNLMASYALQWKAMNIAREMGCSEYDMFGVSPAADPDHPMYGLYRFKSGFGGRMYHTLGCWDYILDPGKYNAFSTMELVQEGYHTN
ncbi:MAG: peptidoglycan bridge formation glycyltransferase FemA/FemB family protein [Bacteroidales bacterium]|nr:peptidoglycan bridge formation glycyltransferase FemA/FemB family protein [Bacteroidales bacterium]